MACAVGFSVVVLTAAMVPLSVRWLPLLVPVAVAVLYVLVVRPFVRESTWGSGRRM
jgi:fatty acid desaturase